MLPPRPAVRHGLRRFFHRGPQHEPATQSWCQSAITGGMTMTDIEFLAKFEGCTFNRNEWRHEAHVRIAWLYLTRLPFEPALERIRAGIQKLATTFHRRSTISCLRTPGRADTNTASQSYHETITTAFARLIAHRLDHSDTFPTFRDRNPDLFDRTLSPLLTHYSRELLDSPGARQAFVAPDLVALPEPAGDRPGPGFIEPAGQVSYPVEHDRTRVCN